MAIFDPKQCCLEAVWCTDPFLIHSFDAYTEAARDPNSIRGTWLKRPEQVLAGGQGGGDSGDIFKVNDHALIMKKL